ncbi:MAG TPA: flagellar basal body rod protein FlgB [Acidisarcina sp.]
MPDIVSTPLISSLERFLSLTTAAQQRTTSNMANIDTPGYRTREVDFQTEMRRAERVAGFPAAEGESAGWTGAGLTPVAREVRGLLERPDGNNVNLDREGLMLSESQLQYQVGVQLVKHEFHQIFSAISGGS